MQTHNSNPHSAIVNPQSHGSALPKPGSIGARAVELQHAQALLRLDHSIRTEAHRLLGRQSAIINPQSAIEDLVLEARRVFTIVNAIPVARDRHGETMIGPNGFPLTPEQWLRSRLAT